MSTIQSTHSSRRASPCNLLSPTLTPTRPESGSLPDHDHPPHSSNPTTNSAGYPFLHPYPTPSPQPLHLSPVTHQFSEGLASHGFAYSQLSTSQPQLPRGPTPVQFHPRSHSEGQIYQSQGMFKDANHFSLTNCAFIDGLPDIFMERLLQHTILGAEFDSSDRDPPPRCHPGTRVAMLQRCLDFIVKSHDEGKLRWVVGPAGVGKSAVMQYVAENIPVDVTFASIFLSVEGRQDGTKIILTIAYRLAVKCLPYRQFIQNEISLDPSLLRKSLLAQFNKFIIEPFILHNLLDPCLILIDGLDECDNITTQLELLGLISKFCTTYPTSPIKWIVASRPEPHILSLFDRVKGTLAFTKEEILIDSEEACEDVQRYLRDELKNVQLASPTLQHKRHWPLKYKFVRIANAAGGLFAYASTVVRYISNPSRGNPVTLLTDVLAVIEGTKLRMLPGKGHPMDHLDALYTRIISNIPDGVEQDTKKLLLLCLEENRATSRFRLQCNFLGLTEDDAYGAIHHTYSVVKVPKPNDADEERLGCLHDSFKGYLSDFKRSKFFRDVQNEADELATQAYLRVVEEVVDGSDAKASHEGGIICENVDRLKGSADVCANVPLSWPGDERFKMTDDELKLMLYRTAVADVLFRFEPGKGAFTNLSYFRLLTTRFTALGSNFRRRELRDFAFDNFPRELMDLGILKQVPLRTLDHAAIRGGIDLRFMSPVGKDTKLSDPWNASCKHEKRKIDDLKQLLEGWTTTFGISSKDVTSSQDTGTNYQATGNDKANTDAPRVNGNTGDSPASDCRSVQDSEVEHCHHCSGRFSLHFANHPDQLVTVSVDSTNMCYVEFVIDDPEGGGLQWRYRFCHSGPPGCVDSS